MQMCVVIANQSLGVPGSLSVCLSLYIYMHMQNFDQHIMVIQFFTPYIQRRSDVQFCRYDISMS